MATNEIFVGINVGDDRSFILSILDENKKVVAIHKFWKEGVLWFIDHYKPRLISFDSPIKKNIKIDEFTPQILKEKYSVDLARKIKEFLKFEFADIENIKDKTKKLLIRTDVDKFLSKIIRKDLLAEDTMEGIEQRLYNLSKTGIYLDKNMISKERKMAKRQIRSIISAFCSYSVYNGSYEIENDEEFIVIPKYIYIMKKNRMEAENEKRV